MKRSFVAACIFLSGILAFGLAFGYAGTVHAGAEHNMTGWAWSSNIGWISFNSTNDHDPSTAGVQTSSVNYGVHKDGSGNLVGYAWASSIGWIQFGSLSGFPTGSGTYAGNAQIVSGNARGWARALSYGGGWDGWIALSGSYGSGSYGVSNSGVDFTGYAWGGPVVGWVLFDVQNVYPTLCQPDECGVTLSGDASLDVRSGGGSLSGKNNVEWGTIPTFEWTLTNMSGSTCAISTLEGDIEFAQSSITSSGSAQGSQLTEEGEYTYQIQCTGTVSLTKTVSFTVLPQPASFSLGDPDTMRIQFLSPAAAESETKGIYVFPSGGFSEQVHISITGPASAPASTTFEYSFNDGGSYSSNPGTITLTSPYTSGVPFKVRVTRQIGAPAFEGPFTITLTGSASGFPNATKIINLSPTSFTPVYDEI